MLIPDMTGYTTPEGKVEESSHHTTSIIYYAWRAFSTDQYSWTTSGDSNPWISYMFAKPVSKVSYIYMRYSGAGGTFDGTETFYLHDGTEWRQVRQMRWSTRDLIEQEIVMPDVDYPVYGIKIQGNGTMINKIEAYGLK